MADGFSLDVYHVLEDTGAAIGDLMDNAKLELALALWDVTKRDLELRVTYLRDLEPPKREGYAQRYVPTFRWMLLFAPDAARDVLTEVIGTEPEDEPRGWTGETADNDVIEDGDGLDDSE